MKIQLGKTAKTHDGKHLAADRLKSGRQRGAIIRAIQEIERYDGVPGVKEKRVTLELELDEAEKLAKDLLEVVEKHRREIHAEQLAAEGQCEHRCIHCGHEWVGGFNELCPLLLTRSHPANDAALTRAESTTLDFNGYTWIEGRDAHRDRLRTDAYDRDTLNSLHARGLIEWLDDQASWRPTEAGLAVIHAEREARRIAHEKEAE